MEEKEGSSVSTAPSTTCEDTTNSPTPQQPHQRNMNTTVTIPTSGSNVGGEMLGKKKRGRPRKYDADGYLRLQPHKFHSSPPTPQQHQHQHQTGFSFTPPPQPSSYNNNTNDYHIDFSSSPPPLSSSSKRGRGRPPGSGNWQLLSSLGELFANTAGADFTPHIVTVNSGEDVVEKIMSFCRKGSRGVCVLSANGSISNITIRQPGSYGGVLTYEGRFEILSLSGSYTIVETGGMKSQAGGLSISLASSDGRVIGGGVLGLLVAASPIQIVVGSFTPNAYKAYKKKYMRENTAAYVTPGAPGTVTMPRPISQVSQARPDSGAAPVFSLPGQANEGADNAAYNSHLQQNPANSFDENYERSEPVSDYPGPSPDINLSLPIEEDVQGVF